MRLQFDQLVDSLNVLIIRILHDKTILGKHIDDFVSQGFEECH